MHRTEQAFRTWFIHNSTQLPCIHLLGQLSVCILLYKFFFTSFMHAQPKRSKEVLPITQGNRLLPLGHLLSFPTLKWNWTSFYIRVYMCLLFYIHVFFISLCFVFFHSVLIKLLFWFLLIFCNSCVNIMS